MNIKINPEYAKLAPPLTELEFNSLKESIKTLGQREAIIVNQNWVIIAGHNRYRICQELNIEPKIVMQSFASELEEKLFVIDSNLERRHLSPFARVELALSKKPILQEIARKNMSLAKIKDKDKADRNLTPLGRVDEKIASGSHTSRDTVRKVEFLLQNAPVEKLDRLRQGKTKIFKEYQRVQKTIAIQKLANTISCSNVISKSSSTNLMLGDMRELGKNIPDESIDLIFTDPPYANLSSYEDLLKLYCTKLKQGSNLVMYAPNPLDKIFRMLEGFDLKYADIIAVHQNGDTSKMWKYGVWADCKFLIWCFKGDKPTKFHDLSNFIQSEAVDKHNHKWEQSTVEASTMMKALTLEGMTVLDPFMGSGTTGIAALELGLKFTGIDNDPIAFSKAQARLSSIYNRTKLNN